MKIMFDVDGTLIDFDDMPRWGIVDMLKTLKGCGHYIIVASGGGADYADLWVRRLFLKDYVDEICGKPLIAPLVESSGERLYFADVSFDDEDVLLAKVNIKV